MNHSLPDPRQKPGQYFGHLWLGDGTVYKFYTDKHILHPPAVPDGKWVALQLSELRAAAARATAVCAYHVGTGADYVWPVDEARRLTFGPIDLGYGEQICLPLEGRFRAP